MAKIIYKEGCEGQNRLESIDGIEIEMFNGQRALIYPKYEVHEMFEEGKEIEWDAKRVSEIEALKKTDNLWATGALLRCGSPAAEFASNFRSDKHGIFGLPTLLAAMEIQDQKKDIDALAETIKGADLLRNFSSLVWSCSHFSSVNGWIAVGNGGYAGGNDLCNQLLCIPLVLYR